MFMAFRLLGVIGMSSKAFPATGPPVHLPALGSEMGGTIAANALDDVDPLWFSSRIVITADNLCQQSVYGNADVGFSPFKYLASLWVMQPFLWRLDASNWSRPRVKQAVHTACYEMANARVCYLGQDGSERSVPIS